MITTKNPADRYTPGTGDARYDVTHYDLRLQYRVATNRLTAHATLSVFVREATAELRLDLAGLGVASVTVDGARVRYRQRGAHVTVQLGREASEGERCEITVAYSGKPGPRSTPWGEIGWEELADGSIVSGQPNGSSTWFPVNDRLGYQATFCTSIAVDNGYTAVAIGALTGVTRSASGRTWVYEQRVPTSVYLATVQIGRYTRKQYAGDSVAPVHLAYPKALERDVLREFAIVPAALGYFVSAFGPYPFDAYTVVVTEDDLEIPLESQGLATFGANATRRASREPRLVVHELAHMWFGNSVGLTNWRDIWLNEGFACYAEWLWSEHAGERSAESLARHHYARVAAEPDDLLLSDPGPRLLFDDRVYKRGALTLHALRAHAGGAVFFGLLQAWTAEYRHALVTSADFERLAAAHVGHDLTGFFDAWLRQRTLPPFVSLRAQQH